MDITRRGFVQAAGMATAAAAAGAQAAASARQARADEDGSLASQVAREEDADVVVVGSGVSGLAAAVQAAELGLSVTVIEAAPTRGAVGPEGICALGSAMQAEQGIEVEIGDVIEHDELFFNFRLNPLFWRDMLGRSGGNIDWLVEKGVQFTGQVDEYKGMGKFKLFHWFPGDHACATAYGDPMEAALAGLGGKIVLETRGRELVTDEADKVRGVIATDAAGDAVQYNAQAVILATGGYMANYDMVAERFQGLYAGRWICDGMPCNVGDGLNMAVALGGVDVTRERCALAKACTNTQNGSISNLGKLPSAMWVNEQGRRYVNEACDSVNTRCSINAMLPHKNTYAILDADIISAVEDSFPDGLALATEEAGLEGSEVLMADTLEELAEKAGFDAETFLGEVAYYNELCDAGEDKLYKKDASKLQRLQTPPFFAFRQIVKGHGNIGGLAIDLDCRVIRKDYTPIEGLYAVGVESNMNYRETYTIEVPGSAMCNNVDSGRVAAKRAAAAILGTAVE